MCECLETSITNSSLLPLNAWEDRFDYPDGTLSGGLGGWTTVSGYTALHIVSGQAIESACTQNASVQTGNLTWFDNTKPWRLTTIGGMTAIDDEGYNHLEMAVGHETESNFAFILSFAAGGIASGTAYFRYKVPGGSPTSGPNFHVDTSKEIICTAEWDGTNVTMKCNGSNLLAVACDSTMIASKCVELYLDDRDVLNEESCDTRWFSYVKLEQICPCDTE